MILIQKFHEGGIFMYFILVLGIFTVYIMVDRLIALYMRFRSVPAGFRQQVRDYIKRGDLEGAIEFSKTHKKLQLARIIELACNLKMQSSGDEELQARLDEALSDEIQQMDKRTSFLAVFGNVATLLGLLGTISGMITSFAAVSGLTSAERTTMLSKGISEAMNCTAFGLIVAIPALVTYALFQNKTERLVSGLTDSVAKIYHDLVFLYDTKRGNPSAIKKMGNQA